MRRYPTERLHNPGSDRELCSAPLPPPRPGRRVRRRCGLGGRGLTSSGDWSLVALTLRWSLVLLSPWGGEGGGGGEEACGIPGGGEEDEDRGREVQGGVDEAQCGREEEGGRGRGELGRGGRR